MDDLGASPSQHIGSIVLIDPNNGGIDRVLARVDSIEALVDAAAAGDDVAARTRSTANEVARRVGRDIPVYDGPKRVTKGVYQGHYHDARRRGGHIFGGKFAGSGRILGAIAIYSAFAVAGNIYAQAQAGLADGVQHADGLIESTMDFIRHTRDGDSAMADLDAAIAAAEYHNAVDGDPIAALVFWDRLTGYAEE